MRLDEYFILCIICITILHKSESLPVDAKNGGSLPRRDGKHNEDFSGKPQKRDINDFDCQPHIYDVKYYNHCPPPGTETKNNKECYNCQAPYVYHCRKNKDNNYVDGCALHTVCFNGTEATLYEDPIIKDRYRVHCDVCKDGYFNDKLHHSSNSSVECEKTAFCVYEYMVCVNGTSSSNARCSCNYKDGFKLSTSSSDCQEKGKIYCIYTSCPDGERLDGPPDYDCISINGKRERTTASPQKNLTEPTEETSKEVPTSKPAESTTNLTSTENSSVTTTPSNGESNSISTDGIVGIIIGAVILVVLIICGVSLYIHRNNSGPPERSSSNGQSANDGGAVIGACACCYCFKHRNNSRTSEELTEMLPKDEGPPEASSNNGPSANDGGPPEASSNNGPSANDGGPPETSSNNDPSAIAEGPPEASSNNGPSANDGGPPETSSNNDPSAIAEGPPEASSNNGPSANDGGPPETSSNNDPSAIAEGPPEASSNNGPSANDGGPPETSSNNDPSAIAEGPPEASSNNGPSANDGGPPEASSNNGPSANDGGPPETSSNNDPSAIDEDTIEKTINRNKEWLDKYPDLCKRILLNRHDIIKSDLRTNDFLAIYNSIFMGTIPDDEVNHILEIKSMEESRIHEQERNAKILSRALTAGVKGYLRLKRCLPEHLLQLVEKTEEEFIEIKSKEKDNNASAEFGEVQDHDPLMEENGNNE